MFPASFPRGGFVRQWAAPAMRRLLPTLLVGAALVAPDVANADRAGVVVTAGISQKSDQLMLGVGGTWHGIGFELLAVDLVAQVGVGVDFMTVRPALHLVLDTAIDDFRLYPIVGPSLLIYRARGDYARFCAKVDLACDRVDWGFDLGLGLGWRWLTLETTYGTGALPLITAVGKATWLF